MVAALFVAFGIAAVTGTLWQRSVAETRRAEAQKLIALGQLELNDYPSTSVAYAIASLELADTPESRRLALEALWRGPVAFVVSEERTWDTEFSPDNSYLIQARGLRTIDRSPLSIIHENGSSVDLGVAHPEAIAVHVTVGADTHHFHSRAEVKDSILEHILWSIPERRRLTDIRYREPAYTVGVAADTDRNRFVLLCGESDRFVVDAMGFDGSIERLGTFDLKPRSTPMSMDTQRGRWLAAAVDNDILVYEIGDDGLSESRLLGRVDDAVADIVVDPLGRFVAAAKQGEIRLWSLAEKSPPVVLQGPTEIQFLDVTPDGSLLEAAVRQEGPEGHWHSWVWTLSENEPRFLRRFDLGGTGWGGWRWDTVGRKVARWGPDTKIRLWSVDGPADAEPLVLNRGDNLQVNTVSFDQHGRWLASADLAGLAVWPVAERFPLVIRRHQRAVFDLTFAPDGGWLASSSGDSTVRLWPLDGNPPPAGKVFELGVPAYGLAASSDGTRILIGGNPSPPKTAPFILSLTGGEPTNLHGFAGQVWGVALSADGRLAAAAGGRFNVQDRVIRVWDVATGKEVTVLEVGEHPMPDEILFTTGNELLSVSDSGLLRWNVETGERELLYEGIGASFATTADGRLVLMVEKRKGADDVLVGPVILLDRDSGVVTRLDRFGDDVRAVAIDPEGAFAVTGDKDGEVRVGPLTGEDPHILLGHEGTVMALAIDPLGRWIASGGMTRPSACGPCPTFPNALSTPCRTRSSSPSSKPSPTSASSETRRRRRAGSSPTTRSRDGRKCRRGDKQGLSLPGLWHPALPRALGSGALPALLAPACPGAVSR